jgi:hypothetical protein
MKLDDVGAELGGEFGHAPALEVRHGDDDVVGFELVPPCLDDVPVASLPNPIDAHPISYGQSKPSRIRFEVVGHLVLRRERIRRRREGHSRESVVTRRREETQRVPPLAPRVTDPIAGVENDESNASQGQVVPHRKSSLARPDHDHVHRFRGRLRVKAAERHEGGALFHEMLRVKPVELLLTRHDLLLERRS